MEAPLPAPAMRWLSDVLLAANHAEHLSRSMAAHAERLGRSMVAMTAGSITLRPTPPAYFMFGRLRQPTTAADGAWAPYMLRPDAEAAHKMLASKWYPTYQMKFIVCAGVTVARFACGSAAAKELPGGVEAGLVAWLRERGYGAEAMSVMLDEEPASALSRLPRCCVCARIMRVSW